MSWMGFIGMMIKHLLGVCTNFNYGILIIIVYMICMYMIVYMFVFICLLVFSNYFLYFEFKVELTISVNRDVQRARYGLDLGSNINELSRIGPSKIKKNG